MADRREINSTDEIEIAPEVIEAGMREYGARWLGLRDANDIVAREMLAAAYRAMTAARRRLFHEVAQTD